MNMIVGRLVWWWRNENCKQPVWEIQLFVPRPRPWVWWVVRQRVPVGRVVVRFVLLFGVLVSLW